MSRILILTNIDIGLYKFRKELLEALIKENEVYFCVPDGKYVEKIEKIGCIFIECPYMDRHGINPFNEFYLLRFYKKIVQRINPDIVFTYTIKPNVYGGMVCAKMDVPYVVNVTGLGTAVENSGILQKITLVLYKMGLRKAQKIYFQNNENKEFMIEYGIVKNSYDLLPGSGVNLDYYTLIPYPSRDTVDFIFIARVMKEKGIDQYLEAAKIIREKHPKTRFHICGFCEQNYQEILKELDNNEVIIYHGLVDNMNEIYEMSACIVHPTYYPEGLSNVLLESCACGRPIITTNRAGCREVIEDGVNGFVVREKNTGDLVNAIERFLKLTTDERYQMGIQGRKKIEAEFDRQIVIKKYLEEVKKISC